MKYYNKGYMMLKIYWIYYFETLLLCDFKSKTAYKSLRPSLWSKSFDLVQYFPVGWICKPKAFPLSGGCVLNKELNGMQEVVIIICGLPSGEGKSWQKWSVCAVTHK